MNDLANLSLRGRVPEKVKIDSFHCGSSQLSSGVKGGVKGGVKVVVVYET